MQRLVYVAVFYTKYSGSEIFNRIRVTFRFPVAIPYGCKLGRSFVNDPRILLERKFKPG